MFSCFATDLFLEVRAESPINLQRKKLAAMFSIARDFFNFQFSVFSRWFLYNFVIPQFHNLLRAMKTVWELVEFVSTVIPVILRLIDKTVPVNFILFAY